MYGVAISLYDKFDDVRILVETIRHNWDEDYYISVCCNHPDAEEELSDLDVDALEQGAQINYDPSMSGQRKHINLMCRVHDTFKRSCQNAIEAGCDYVVHNHADAWMLDEGRFHDLIDGLKEKDCTAAVRGRDPTCRRPDFLLGQPMDQYIVFDGEYCKEVGFFDFAPLELLPHTNNHTGLMLLLLGRIGLSNTWFYSSSSDDLWWDKRQKDIHAVRPGIYVPKWEYLHVATESFPGELGKHVQGGYLRKFGITDGPFIEQFLQQYDRPLDEVNSELREIERRQDKRLSWQGYSAEKINQKFNRKFDRKAELLNQSPQEKARQLLLNVAEELYYSTMTAIHKLPYLKNKRFTGERFHREMYRDVNWPEKNINDVYREAVEISDYPSPVRDTWFEDRENQSH